MTIEKIINQIKTISVKEFKKYETSLLNTLKNEGITKKNCNNLLDRINAVIKITDNPKTRESLIKSYYRIEKNEINKDGRNSSISIEITKKCNKNCKHCYSNSYNKTKMMSDRILDSIIKLARSEYKHIFLTGGEPTLDPRIFTIAEKNPDMMFFMFTNGSTINENYAKQLSCYGNIVPMLGIDGQSEFTHDQFKGPGSYKDIMRAVDNLNKYNVAWGYISMVTEINARDILDDDFVKNLKEKGAFIARYLEYLPVGQKANRDYILSGETYYLLEKRKKELIKSGEIYIQETVQKKCTGLLSFDVDGYIKNCPFFHYAKYNIVDNDIKESVRNTIREWVSFDYTGECPLYSDPLGLKNHLEKCGWKHILDIKEEYLNNRGISRQMMENYQRFLEINELD